MRDEPPLTFEHADGFARLGRVESVSAEIVSVSIPALTPGDVLRLELRNGGEVLAEVRAARAGSVRCTPLADVNSEGSAPWSGAVCSVTCWTRGDAATA